MRWFYSMLFFAAVLGSSLHAQERVWVLDRNNSSVRFSVNHMMISEITGTFKDFFASVQFNEEHVLDSSFFVSIQSKSIDTGLAIRDNHLRSKDFFDCDTYPEMHFKGKSMTKVSEGHYKLKGDLTIKKTTKEVDIDLVHGGIATDYWGNRRTGFRLEGTFNRFDFGLDWNELLQAGGLIVGQDVHVTVVLELFQQLEIHDIAETTATL